MTLPPRPSPALLAHRWRRLCGTAGYIVENPTLAQAIENCGQPNLFAALCLLASRPASDADTYARLYLDPLYSLISSLDGTAFTPAQHRTMALFSQNLDGYMMSLLDKLEASGRDN